MYIVAIGSAISVITDVAVTLGTIEVCTRLLVVVVRVDVVPEVVTEAVSWALARPEATSRPGIMAVWYLAMMTTVDVEKSVSDVWQCL